MQALHEERQNRSFNGGISISVRNKNQGDVCSLLASFMLLITRRSYSTRIRCQVLDGRATCKCIIYFAFGFFHSVHRTALVRSEMGVGRE